MKQNRQETVVYSVIWGVLFVVPLLIFYMRPAHSDNPPFRWDEVFFIWRQLGLFFLVFLFHNYLLAPLLILRRKRALYFSSIALLLAVFMAIQCASHHPPKPPRHHQDSEMHMGPRPHSRPPGIVGEHEIVATIVLFLMLGMNIGVKLYFKQRGDQLKMKELERENLEQQLEYLKYQINPHFMMNTLNNIHALVDIDPEEAKETIVELSKIMRFVLYEGSKQLVPLSRELAFLENYVRLMWKRVADQVDVHLDLPRGIPEYEVPPLLLITFVENAFKYGVSYQQESFIDIRVALSDDHLLFTCRNSKASQTSDKQGGVGLQNARRRMDIIYADRYTLDIYDDDTVYRVELSIPLKPLGS